MVWLCATPRSAAFLKGRSGREFAERVAAAWVTAGCLTRHRSRALESHVRSVELALVDRDKPGSYAWPVLRYMAELRFAAGEPPRHVIDELRASYRGGVSMVPSVRTMQRWFTQGRWRVAPSRPRIRLSPPPVGEPRSAWQPFVNMVVYGYGYPEPPLSPGKSRAP